MKHNRQRQQWLSFLTAVTAGLGCLASPVQAQTQQDTIGNAAFTFTEDTVVEFEAKETHGAYQATLGVVNLDTNEQTVLFRETKPFDSFGSGEVQPSSPGNNNTGTPIDYVGTVAGGTIVNGQGEASSLAEYTFKAGTRYSLYLESVSSTGVTRRTVQAINVNAARFQGGLNTGQTDDIIGARISWDDQGLPRPGKDDDFDDFVVEAGGFLQAVPCPPVK